MKYLEDYLSEQMIDDLEGEIAKRNPDDMYILSILSMFDDDTQAGELLEYLKNHPEADRHDIDYQSIVIYHKYHNIK